MDLQRALVLLLLLAFALCTASSVKNGRGGPNFPRQSRRAALNDYLVPPPPPRHFVSRTGRVVGPRPTDSPGYFARLMGWLNPFGSSPSPSPPPPVSHPNSKKFLFPPLSPPPLPPSGPPLGPPLVHPPFSSSGGYDSGPPVGSLRFPPPSDPSSDYPGPPLGPPPGYETGPPDSFPGYHYDAPPGPPGFRFGPPSRPPPGANFNGGPPSGPPPGSNYNGGPPSGPPPGPNHNGRPPPGPPSGSNIRENPPSGPPPGPISGPPPGPPSGPPPDPPLGPPSGPPPGGSPPGPDYSAGPPSGPAPGPRIPPLSPVSAPPRPPNFNGSQPVPYDRPPVPNRPSQPSPPDYSRPTPKGKKCNPCNKVPWVPMQNGGNQDRGYPLPPIPLFSGDAYLPPDNRNSNLDLHGQSAGASHEIRPPDFSYIPPVGHDGVSPPIGPLPNPHLYPGPMPPLFKAENFDNPPRNGGADVEGFIDSVPYPSHYSPQNDSLVDVFSVKQAPVNLYPTGSDQSLGLTSQGYHGSDASTNTHYHELHIGDLGNGQGLEQGLEPNNQAFGESHQSLSGAFDHHDVSSGQGYQGTVVSHLDAPNFGGSGINQQNFFNSNGLDHREYADDLSSSGSIAKDSHAVPQTTTPASNENSPVHYEQSPLVDLSKKGESESGDSLIGSELFVGLDELDDVTTATVRYDSTQDDSYRGQSTTESYSSTVAPARDTTYFWYSTDDDDKNESSKNFDTTKENQTHEVKDTDHVDVSYNPPSAEPGFLWPIVSTTTTAKPKEESYLGSLIKSFDEATTKRSESFPKAAEQFENSGQFSHRQQGAKRNKQVQVIIPYTSQYTPIPFQQSFNDWPSSFERNQPRKVSYLSGYDNYVTQESRNEIKVANPTGKTENVANGIDHTNVQTTVIPTTQRQTVKIVPVNKTNNSIDVHRLQKNIDNWTIQEYSTGTTSSLVLASSPRPYLLPSKKIPEEYLTTTTASDVDERSENVKTYALAGFSFNDLEHEGSASNRVESAHVQVISTDDSKPTTKTTTVPPTKNATSTTEATPWQRYSVSISPVNKERVYVVTPQTMPMTTETSIREIKKASSATKSSWKPAEWDPKKARGKLASFESIERAYQVLPQAVNNLAVASTGPESIPLWGIMEHEEFASMGQDHNDDGDDDDSDFEVPILYSGHSKVSRAKR